MMAPEMDDLAHHIGRWIEHTKNEGFVAPFHIVTVSRNGGMVYGRYDDDGTGMLAATALAEYVPDVGIFVMPINMMLTDSTGKCAHFAVECNMQYTRAPLSAGLLFFGEGRAI